MTLDKLIVLHCLLLLKSFEASSPPGILLYVNLLFLQPEVYSLHFLV